jgi:hypothetical protein
MEKKEGEEREWRREVAVEGGEGKDREGMIGDERRRREDTH